MKKLTLLVLTLTAALAAAERFDYLVRADFFAGMAGDKAAFDRAMKLCEDTLAREPKNPEALVWHGSGTFFMSGQAFQKGDFQHGGELYARGLKEMDEAATLAPNTLGVLIPRGATMLQAASAVPDPAQAKTLAQRGVTDYEKVYEIQKPYFDKLSGHQRGELLFGLAGGYVQLGEKEKARATFEMLAAVGKSSGHEAQAKDWLETGAFVKRQISCTGCHTK